MPDPDKCNCCLVASMFGYNLRQGIFIVCVATIVISGIALISSIASISSLEDSKNILMAPVGMMSLLFSLYCCGIATYQIVISTLLLRSTVKSVGGVFFCSLWFNSHVTIIILYGCFFMAMTVAFFCVRQYVQGVFTLLAGLIYTAVFIYFCAVVDSYSCTINPIIYY